MSSAVSDYNGKALSEGAYVEAWHDGVRYLATVREIRPHAQGDGNFRRVTLVREADGAEVESFSDAVITLADQPAEGEG